ncbi:CHAD domain-containing protein [Sphingobium sp. AS12]|uniref:CYTH and CHAD domain-containing protein n=1 Tax=Sphingobium sp. AS12 TaxID=2849495 RepID=UPI001C31C61C|nr:CHAD domain-containing protein [Sphingobium sp. AS12]MBV2149951.1 CHAD domain-containing protein [Sphingobium sp. AS12]
MTAGEIEEVEMKLELSAEAADAVETSGLFSVEPVIVRQHAIYFDTPDHALFEAGLSLRIRRNGDRRIQTIKVDGGAATGLFVRPEWEWDVEDDRPMLDDTTPIPALIGKKVAEIAPLFTVENERRIWEHDSIEIALDRGRIVAGERETPVREIELEQKGGDLAALFALARRIDAVAPAHLGVLSKAQRGYRLLGPAPTAAKAGPIALAVTMTAADAFLTIARACLKQFRLNEPLVLDHDDPDALHQARVALRRLRSALSIHKPMLGDGRAKTLNGELRWLAGELGKARDLDVLVERATDGPLRDRLGQARVVAYANAAVVLRSDRARTLMIDLAEWIAIGEWRSAPDGQETRDLPAREFAAKALDRFRRKVKKGGRDLEDLDDEARHEVRKAAKKLRYAAEFFAALYERKRERRRHKQFVGALEALQDQLGALNDLATAPDVLNGLGLADDPQAVALLGADKKADLLETAAEAHDALVDARRFWR